MKKNPGFYMTPKTVQRRFNEFGLMGRVARKKPSLSKRNITARLNFAKEHVDWKAEDWANVLFSDEKKFNWFGSDGKSYVRRRPEEEFKKKALSRPSNVAADQVWSELASVGTVEGVCTVSRAAWMARNM